MVRLLRPPLLWMLKLFHAGVGNWGLAIDAGDLHDQGRVLPLTNSAFRSSRRMASSPHRRAERAVPTHPAKVQQETMALLARTGVNPVASCLLNDPADPGLHRAQHTALQRRAVPDRVPVPRRLSSQDPYDLLPLLVMGLFFLQQRFTTMAPGMDSILRGTHDEDDARRLRNLLLHLSQRVGGLHLVDTELSVSTVVTSTTDRSLTGE